MHQSNIEILSSAVDLVIVSLSESTANPVTIAIQMIGMNINTETSQ